MLELLLLKFVESWGMGLLATFLGRYIGKPSVTFPSSNQLRFIVFLKVWILTFLGVIVFGVIGQILGLDKQYQHSFAEFLLPVVAGSYYCRQLLKAS